MRVSVVGLLKSGFHRAVGFLAMFLLGALLPAPSGHAQQDASPVESARRRMEQGQAYFLQGRFGEAAAEFEAAYDSQPFGAFLYNAAVAYENAHDRARALSLFERYLEVEPSAGDNADVRSRIERLRAEILSLTSPSAAEIPGVDSSGPPTALPRDFKSLVSISTEPQGATVTISSGSTRVVRGESPLSQTLSAGDYLVRIEHPDFNVAEQRIRVEAGKVYVVIVNLSQGEFLGYLRVTSQPPGGSIRIDDDSIGARGQTPFEGPIAVGEHHLWVDRPGYETAERDINVGIGEQVSVEVELERVPFGRIRVIGNLANARVQIDGRHVGVVPFEGDLPAGAHLIRVEFDGMKAFEREIDVERGQLTPIRVRLRPEVGRGGAWVAASVAALTLGGSIACVILGEDLRSTLIRARDTGRLASNDERIDYGLYYALGADIGFGITAILSGVALYYFLYDPLPPSVGTVLDARDWAFMPSYDPSSGTLAGVLRGAF